MSRGQNFGVRKRWGLMKEGRLVPFLLIIVLYVEILYKI